MKSAEKNLLLIGAGYVGNTLRQIAVEAGWSVTAVTKSGEEHGTLACDVSALEAVENLRTAIVPPEVIVFCASSGRGGAEAYRAVFLQGVKHLTTAFPGVPLVFVSSSSVYGQVAGEPVDEASETNPPRETGQILLEAEQHVREHGGIVARLAGIYGPGRSALLKKLFSGKAVIEEDGRRLINQIHRDDAASALFFLAQHTVKLAGQTYNVADNHPRSQLETYEGLCRLFDRPLPPRGERDLNKKRGWTHKAVSNQKLREAGWEPQFPDFLEAAVEIAPTIGEG